MKKLKIYEEFINKPNIFNIGDKFIVTDKIFTHLKPMDKRASYIYPGEIEVISLAPWVNKKWITLQGKGISSKNNHARLPIEEFEKLLKNGKIQKI